MLLKNARLSLDMYSFLLRKVLVACRHPPTLCVMFSVAEQQAECVLFFLSSDMKKFLFFLDCALKILIKNFYDFTFSGGPWWAGVIEWFLEKTF